MTRFMAVKNQKELKKSRVIAIIWVALSLFAAVAIGVLGRAYLYPVILGTEGQASAESVFIEMITKIFTQDLRLPFIGGVFLCGILAAIMSTADSQLLVTASSVSKDIYKDILKPQADEKTVLKVSRVTVIVVAVLAFAIAWNPNNSIMGLVSNAWAGLGSAFGPIVLMSLFWRRTNFAGAVAGIVSGGLTVIIWDYIPFINGQTLGTATGLYSLATGFVISILCIVIFSLCTKAPEKEILEEFDRVKKERRVKRKMIRRYFEKAGWGLALVMVVGNIFLGLGIAVFKLSGLGNDPYSGMVMALSDCVGMAYANFLVLINLAVFVIEIIFGRKFIGAGTVVNALLLGYIVTFFYNLLSNGIGIPEVMWQKLIVVCIGVVVCSFGVSMYQTPDVGAAPYDSMSLIMAMRKPSISYFWHRISTDALCALICFLAGGIVGIGTLLSAFCLGPFISFFDAKFTLPLLRKIEKK